MVNSLTDHIEPSSKHAVAPWGCVKHVSTTLNYTYPMSILMNESHALACKGQTLELVTTFTHHTNTRVFENRKPNQPSVCAVALYPTCDQPSEI